MATEKILNTRVILKHDTLANWNKEAALILKEGEIALAKVDTNKTDPISGELVKVPTYLIKVGDGTSKFSALNWVAAPAADVYDWAKKTEAEFTTWVKGLVDVGDIDLSAYYTSAQVDAELAKKVDKVDNKSLVDNDEITKLAGVSEGANKVEKSNTNGNIKVDGEEVVVYTHPDKHAISEVTGLQEALDGKQAAGDYAAEVHTHVKADITDFTHTHTKNEITDFAHTHTASEVTDFATEVAKVKVENATKADEATKATQDGNGKVIADTYAEKTTTLAGYGIGDAYTKTETEGKISEAITTFTNAYITSDGGAIDKLQEIANWIDSDKNGAADVIADIEANAEDIEALDGRLKAAEEELETHGDIVTHNVDEFYTKEQANAAFTDSDEVDDQIDAKITALALGTMSKETATEYVKKSEATGYGDILTKTEAANLYQAKDEYYTKSEAEAKFMDSDEVDAKIDAFTTATPDGTNKMAKYAESDEAGNSIIGTYAQKSELTHTTVTSDISGLDEEGNQIPSGLKVESKTTGATTNYNIIVDDTITWVFDCGDSTNA